jgi:hypothetical protein
MEIFDIINLCKKKNLLVSCDTIEFFKDLKTVDNWDLFEKFSRDPETDFMSKIVSVPSPAIDVTEIPNYCFSFKKRMITFLNGYSNAHGHIKSMELAKYKLSIEDLKTKYGFDFGIPSSPESKPMHTAFYALTLKFMSRNQTSSSRESFAIGYMHTNHKTNEVFYNVIIPGYKERGLKRVKNLIFESMLLSCSKLIFEQVFFNFVIRAFPSTTPPIIN